MKIHDPFWWNAKSYPGAEEIDKVDLSTFFLSNFCLKNSAGVGKSIIWPEKPPSGYE